MERHTVDLRPLLDPKRWRASAELQELLKRPLARPTQLNDRLSEENEKAGQKDSGERRTHKNANDKHSGFHDGDSVVVDLNFWIAQRSRRNFQM